MLEMYNELYLMRHGETAWNRAHRHQGWLDSPLTARGQAQARAMGVWLVGEIAGRTDLAAFTSPQGRAMETAALVFAKTGLSPRPDDRLKEVAFGAWEGLLHEEVRAGWPWVVDAIEREGFLWHFLSPGGETYEDLRQRAEAFLQDLNGPAIVIAHGVLLRVLRAVWHGLTEYDLAAMSGGQGVIFHLRLGHEERRIVPPGAPPRHEPG
ncbi:MAG TPA: histidine phosphatase family protein [Aliiroseovarius sp.]|nr:histidine phosphatase family protein [Aliiroseovarius sp.]